MAQNGLGIFSYNIIMLTNANKNEQKGANDFYCKICDYTSDRKNNLDRHNASTKHKMLTNANQNEQKRAKTKKVAKNKYICECGKEYLHKSSFSRHKKDCKKTENNKSNVDNKMLMEMIKTMQGMIPKLGNNNNNKISINVYLNEHCKSALNLTDFVEKIRFSLEDLYNSEKNGGVQTISDIFIKHLSDVPPHERPIHCSDKKRAQFYVKDENKWAKDAENKKIDGSIMELHNKQLNAVDHEFGSKQDRKTWIESGGADKYVKLVGQTVWDSTNRQKNKNIVRKNIAEATDIKAAMQNIE